MKRTINMIFAAFCTMLLATAPVHAQKKGTAAKVAIVFTVVDADGAPVPLSDVTVGEGLQRHMTDINGKVSVSCSFRDIITVSHDGYANVSIPASVLVDSDTVVLNPDMLFAGKDDDVVLPYGSQKQRYSVGSTVTVKGEDLAKYSSADIRNALTGVIPGVEVKENFGQVGVSPLEHIGQYGAATAVSVTSRGRQVIYMVDDVPVSIDEVPLDPEQIESVTIIRDGLEKTMYGPTAAEGIISIRTRQGEYNNRYLNVNVESGVNVTDRMAKFVSAADYAKLNNIARNNSGLKMLYSRDDVAAYAAGNAYDKSHPSVDFQSLMLKNVMPYTKAGVSSGGGNDVARYYAYLGYTGQDDIYKIGPESGYTNINLNGNLDVKLHRYIRVGFGLVSSIGVRKSNNYGYNSNYTSESESSNTTLGVAEISEVLSDINSIPQLAFPIYADNSEELESPWYAVTSQYTQNPIANILENGSYTETIRNALMNVKLNLDLSFLTPGLSSMTYGAYSSSNLVRLGLAEDYAAYILKDGLDSDGNPTIVAEQSASHSVKQMSNKAKLLDYYSNRFYLVERLSWDRTFADHSVKLNGDFMITKRSQKFITEHRRELNFGLNGTYAYKNRYLVQFALNEHGTYSLLSKWSFSPSLGLGWIISDEGFMADADGIDFLKLRLQASMLKYDSLTSANRDTDNYSWNNSGQKFGPYTTNQWFGSTTSDAVNRTYASMLGNPDLSLETRKEITGGVDLTALDRRLTASLTGYTFLRDGQQTLMSNTIPLVAGTSTGSLYMNYNTTSYSGAELSLGWKDKAGDFSYGVSGWASTQMSRIIKVDELSYNEAYRSKVGKSASAIWGLKYIGQFATTEETTIVPQLFDETLEAGDLKYQDMNGDGYVDDSDACVIGDSSPKLIGAVKLDLAWKNFDLSVMGTGRAFYDLQLTNSYYWNGWGDSNYSEYTLKNAGNPSSPRLTYNKVNNNYKLSGYWLADGSYFKIQSVELGYSVPVAKMRIGNVVRGIRIYARANNLLTISGISDLDPEALSSGLSNYPLMKTFVGGIKMTF